MKEENRIDPLVSLITVNYNQLEVTCEFLESVKKISYPSYEVIVVDNNSPSKNAPLLKKKYPFIRLIESKNNLGFAGGNNLAIRIAKGDFLFFINNDTEVDPDFLQVMVKKFQEDDSIGMMSPKIRFHHTPDTIQYAGYSPMNPYTLRQHLIGYREVDSGQFNQSGYTYSAHGAAMMVPKKILEKVGMMAEIFFLYYEEHDWCARIKQAGFKAYYEANSLVYHKESISTGVNSPLKTYYITRNRILYARRNSKGYTFLLNMLFFIGFSLPKNILVFLFKLRFDLLLSFVKGASWNLFHYQGIYHNPMFNRELKIETIN